MTTDKFKYQFGQHVILDPLADGADLSIGEVVGRGERADGNVFYLMRRLNGVDAGRQIVTECDEMHGVVDPTPPVYKQTRRPHRTRWSDPE